MLGRRWALWSTLGRHSALLIVGLYCWHRVGRGGGCSVVVVVRVVVVAAVVAVAIFFLVATCRFKDTGWISLFEAQKMRGRTMWASHFLGPPGVPRSPNPLSSDDEPPTSLWRGEGRAGILAGDAGNRTHIHQQKGGASRV